MGIQTFVESLTTQHAVGTALNTFTTPKSVINEQALFTIPANWWAVGKHMDITIDAGLSNIVTTPGTITFQVMMGSIIVLTSGAIQLNATAHTLLPLGIDIRLTCRAIGSSTTAKLIGQMWIKGIQPTLTAAQTDDANLSGVFAGPATAPALGTGFNSEIDNVLDFFTGFSVSDGGNGITIHQYSAKAHN